MAHVVSHQTQSPLHPTFPEFGTIQPVAGCGFRMFYIVQEALKYKRGCLGSQEVPMSPARPANGSSRRRKTDRQTPIGPKLQRERNALGPNVAGKKRRDFDPHAFLATIGEGRKFVQFPKKQAIFAQGDTADAVFHIQTGKVRLTVVSNDGKEATIGILGDGEFFGEGALAGQALRIGSATAMTDCAVLRIDKKAMMEALHREHELSDLFVAYLLARNIR
jgi:hypothetical protein